ncbi:transcription-repair coupling factor, partial [Streptococcus suis]
VTKLKAQITENKGKLAVVFNIQQKKEYEILEELISFSEKLKEIKARKAE